VTELQKEAYGPEGDASKHLSLDELNSGLEALPPAPRDSGTLALIVRRFADGERETPKSAGLSPAEGIPGDGWNRRPAASP